MQQLIIIRIELYTYPLNILEGNLIIKFKKIFLKEMVDQSNAVKNL